MSDNDDDRMDRAKRIRRMREGDRDDEQDEQVETVADGDGEDDGESVEDADVNESVEDTDENESVEDAAVDESDEDAAVDESVEDADAVDDATDSSGEEADTLDESEESDNGSFAEKVQEAASAGVDDSGADEDDGADDADDGDGAEDIAAKVQQAASAAAETTESEQEAATTDDGESEDVSAPLPERDELEEALEGSGASAEAGGAPADGGGATAQASAATEPGGPEAAPTEDADAGAEAVAGDAPEEAAAPGPDVSDEATSEEETRVLEFALEGEYYCLDIAYIEEIVKEGRVTRVPNTPEWVEGVVDLRGQITTILNPKVPIGKENTEPGDLIVVFDEEAFEDQGNIGWVVDDVRQVSPIVESEVNDPPMEEAYIEGVIDREDDDQFVIWMDPDLVLAAAESDA
jgi:purine-binding chemotaxis protein CheW